MAAPNLTANSNVGHSAVRRVLFLCEPDYRWYINSVIESVRGLDGYQVSVGGAAGLDLIESRREEFELIVTVHSSVGRVLQFCAGQRGRTPSLAIQDGIIEYRSSNHRVQGHFRYRPLCTDFIAVFGERSRHLVEAYGTSPERIFVTGSPRFDRYFAAPMERQPTEPCLLVTMANRPAYGRERMVRFYKLLIALLRYCDEHRIKQRLRLGRGATEQGVEPIEKAAPDLSAEDIRYFRSRAVSDVSLEDDLRSASAVVTTPSTVSLEAMSLERPVAHLNFDSETVFLQSAWTLSSPDDFAVVVPQLFHPPSYKMAFQRVVLNENLVVGTSATATVVNLINDLSTAAIDRKLG